MIKYKHILFVPVMEHFKEVPVKDPEHEKHKIGPAMAQPVDEIAPFQLTKEGCQNHQWKNDQQEGCKGDDRINGEEDPQDPGYEPHNLGRI
jgi:hypothetical protein